MQGMKVDVDLETTNQMKGNRITSENKEIINSMEEVITSLTDETTVNLIEETTISSTAQNEISERDENETILAAETVIESTSLIF